MLKYRDQFLMAGLSQIKEGLNYGFVYSGPQLQYGREWQWQKSDNRIELESQIGLATVFNKGLGLGLHLTPLNFRYLFKINDQLCLGPGLLSDYNYGFYPDLHIGYDFWFSHYSTEVAASFRKTFQKRSLTVRFTSSLFGLVSRTRQTDDTYFFHLGFKYALKDLNSKMEWGFVNQYNVSRLEIALNPNQTGRVCFSYIIDYSGYFKDPRWVKLDYGIKLTIKS
jgi:hypothetical protein